MFVLVLIFGITVLDQATKYVVSKYIGLDQNIVIIPKLFDLRHIHNTGAAWGVFDDSNGWLVVFSIIILVSLIVFRRSFLSDTLPHKITMALMIGGIVGNVLDRLRLGYVVDFFDFHWKAAYHFPAFNIADSSICIGVAVYIISSYWVSLRRLRMPQQNHGGTEEEQKPKPS